MDLASLAMFRTVARERSITRAADLLGRVPSNVTTRIQQLETEIGVALFERDKRGMELTVSGKVYLDYVERILSLADEARQTVNPTRPAGRMRIGSMECALASRLPAPLAAYNAQWPEVTLELSAGPTQALIGALLAHRIDCGFIAAPPGAWCLSSAELEKVPLFREELLLVLPPGHPVVRTPQDIGPKSLAAFAPGCTYRMLAEAWLNPAGRGGFAVHDIGSYHAMFACTVSGACVSVMPKSVFALLKGAAQVVVRPLMTVDTYLAWRPGFATPAFSALRDEMMKVANIEMSAHAEK
ncbi:LysR family transcriptional regulator [Acidocella sp.]|uniref:LysR family transcriptional regulator n=1 Tax=Acidocella sp. TaxID=50710 RepID=UPI003CFDBCEC